MQSMQYQSARKSSGSCDGQWRIFLAVLLSAIQVLSGVALCDVPARISPNGIVPNPGTQQMELPNINAPGVYNVFEFPQFCANCHGGNIDQQVNHYGNWSGMNMANSGRDPFFRANNLVVNYDAFNALGANGAGNICWRCHSPNGWYSARLDELLGGKINGTSIQQSLLASTDMQGIMCEFCHRTVGNVTMQDTRITAVSPNDPAWNMLAGATDWPHAGVAYPEGPVAGLPYGDTSFMINDGKVYQADLPGNFSLNFSDLPSFGAPINGLLGTYTGQTYGVYPQGWTGPVNPAPAGMPATNSAGEKIVYNEDGNVRTHFEEPVPPPFIVGTTTLDYNGQSVSPRHATHGNGFLTSSEMCGTCHDLTIPTANHGMPEQRTYTEWKFSDFGTPDPVPPAPTKKAFTICQDCHMGEYSHELQDGMTGTFKADPAEAGYFPYAKARPVSAIHKFHGANRDLPEMLKSLFPDVDMEITGHATGRDTRPVNGVLSNRNNSFNRHLKNTELQLADAVAVQITAGPTVAGANGSVTVKVTNNAGHAIPSGYPDGRRAFLRLVVTDAEGAQVYESGYWDPTTANLYNDSTMAGFTRAHTPTIDSAANAVMVYEKRTGSLNPDGTTYNMSVSLLNDKILFDNRLRPSGWKTVDYERAGVKQIDYTGPDNAAVPFSVAPGTAAPRYADGQNWDSVTYSFAVPTGAVLPLKARAELLYQSHHREFVEYLKNRNNAIPKTFAGPRPVGQPDILDPNYPLTPNYLGKRINLTAMKDLDGNPLKDNWGSLAYAAWMLAGKGAPCVMASHDSSNTAIPAAPTGVVATPSDPFRIDISWAPVPNAEGYIVWTQFGLNTAADPAMWDRLAVVRGATTFSNEGVKVGKTYGYKVVAFNGMGFSLDSTVVTARTLAGSPSLPDQPLNLQVTAATYSTVSLLWTDMAANETGFIVERQNVPESTSQVYPGYVEIARIPTSGVPGVKKDMSFVDSGLLSGRKYNYRVAAYNGSGNSLHSLSVEATTPATNTLAADLGKQGLWIHRNAAWTRITAADAEKIVGLSVLYGDFDVGGLWSYDANGWKLLAKSNPQDILCDGDVLYGDFGADGIYMYDAGVWTRLTTSDPVRMAAGGSVLYADFGPMGIYKYERGAWSLVTAATSTSMITSGSTLFGDFPGAGLYRYDGSWQHLSGSSPQTMTAFGPKLYAGFGAAGIYMFDGTGWAVIDMVNASALKAADGIMYADCVGEGLYQYDGRTSPAEWTEISPMDAGAMEASAACLYVSFPAVNSIQEWDGVRFNVLSQNTAQQLVSLFFK